MTIPNRRPGQVYAAMILVYGDDSSDEKQKRVCSVAVAVRLEKHWEEFEPKWVA